MLRITAEADDAPPPRWRLEGRLVGPWVAELRRVIDAADAPRDGVRLDLSGVNFVDDDGLRLLHEWRDRGAVYERVTPFVAELLRARFP